MRHRMLSVYLNDHLAGATLGIELARRTARENRGSPLGAFLSDELVPQIAEDRETLERLMARLGVARSRLKIAAGWVAEKLGRLKLNGELTSYSPLSRVLELEGLAAGIEAKRALWIALQAVTDGEAAVAEFDFGTLAKRAESQRSQLEQHRLLAATRAFRA